MYGPNFAAEARKHTLFFIYGQLTWRIIIKEGAAHFYEKPDKGYVNDRTGDLQRIDMGIALYHFEYAVAASGRTAVFEIKDPGIEVPVGWRIRRPTRLRSKINE